MQSGLWVRLAAIVVDERGDDRRALHRYSGVGNGLTITARAPIVADADGGEGGGGEDDDDETGDEDEDPELRRKITEVLRANGIEAATGLSDDEEEEDQMDDEQMMAIDDQLAQIFRERTKGKGKG